MNDEPSLPESPPTPPTRGRKFKARELPLSDGGRLVLHANGSIDHVDDAGHAERSWALDDPEWSQWALRFGLHLQDATVPPTGRNAETNLGPRR